MRWAFRIRRKISAALLLTAVFVLIFLKNMVDDHHVEELGDSFSTVYEDRLVVGGYIYELSSHLFSKKLMIDTARTQTSAAGIRPAIDAHSASMDELIHRYAATKLTDAEALSFERLRENIATMRKLEHQWFEQRAGGSPVASLKRSMDREFDEARRNLTKLSDIQVAEGKILNDHSKQIIAGSELLDQFELGLLIAIALMVVALALESSNVLAGRAQQGRWN